MTAGKVVLLSALTVMGGAVLAKKLNKKIPGFNG